MLYVYIYSTKSKGSCILYLDLHPQPFVPQAGALDQKDTLTDDELCVKVMWCSIVGATVTVHQFFCILH